MSHREHLLQENHYLFSGLEDWTAVNDWSSCGEREKAHSGFSSSFLQWKLGGFSSACEDAAGCASSEQNLFKFFFKLVFEVYFGAALRSSVAKPAHYSS